MEPLRWLYKAQIHIGDSHILWREVIGNLFGLASALGGMRRRVWAWPVGIVGNVLLFTVFLGAVGSILATWAMARGWIEFWLVWIAVDAVGVPSLIEAKLYPSAALYGFYGLFCVVGFVAWLRAERSSPTHHRQETPA
jgi:nicotinamide riboside transporter PnuC